MPSSSLAATSHHVSSAPVYQSNGHVPSSHGNGHAHAPLPGDRALGVEMNALETMPMLTLLPENEMSDAKVSGVWEKGRCRALGSMLTLLPEKEMSDAKVRRVWEKGGVGVHWGPC